MIVIGEQGDKFICVLSEFEMILLLGIDGLMNRYGEEKAKELAGAMHDLADCLEGAWPEQKGNE